MTWQVKELLAMREEFVTLAKKEGGNFQELCRRFKISPRCGYKWLKRYKEQGKEGLVNQSRKRKSQSKQTKREVEAAILNLRDEHPAWGARKLKKRLENMGYQGLPSWSTITQILRRHGRLQEDHPSAQGAWKRFCHEQPNELWQMDFKGQFLMTAEQWCFPFTMLDDHSRYSLAVDACANQRTITVKESLTRAFSRYGLPKSILADNGSPWGCPNSEYTQLGVWLLRLGINLLHGRAYHPQTQGKEERFHRTLKAELLSRNLCWNNFQNTQRHFDAFRHTYNTQRPHDALALEVPASLYHPSKRSIPAELPPIEYLDSDVIRFVKAKGEITFNNHFFYIGNAFQSLPIALRQTAAEGLFDVFFSWKKLGSIDLRDAKKQKGFYNPLASSPLSVIS